jgi:hypothetical protein
MDTVRLTFSRSKGLFSSSSGKPVLEQTLAARRFGHQWRARYCAAVGRTYITVASHGESKWGCGKESFTLKLSSLTSRQGSVTFSSTRTCCPSNV